MRFALFNNTTKIIGGQWGQCLTRLQLTKSIRKFREVGILEYIAEAYLIGVKDRMLNVQLIPLIDTLSQPKNIVEVAI